MKIDKKYVMIVRRKMKDMEQQDMDWIFLQTVQRKEF